MAHNVHLLNNMNLIPETLELAKSILREASVKTKPGSGFELGPHTTGLPAICAYIASKRLKTNELTRGTAQVASCLKNADFEKAFHIVEAAIGGGRRTGSKVASYQSMCLNYQASEQHLGPFFQQAERALLIDARYNPERTAEVRYGIFFWVLSLWKHQKLSREQFSEENSLYYKTFSSIIAFLNDRCKTLKEEIVQKAKNQTTTSPTKAAPIPSRRSPLKRPLRELPSKDSPHKRRLTSPEPTRLPTQGSQSMHKFLSNLESRPFPETPTKKRKLEYLPVVPQQRPATSTPLKSILRTSPRKGTTTSTPTRVKLDVARFETNALSDSDSEMDTGPLPALNLSRQRPSSDESDSDMDADSTGELEVDESMMEEPESFLSSPSKVETAPIRRFRPIYLDYKQWNNLDPRLQIIYTKS